MHQPKVPVVGVDVDGSNGSAAAVGSESHLAQATQRLGRFCGGTPADP